MKDSFAEKWHRVQDYGWEIASASLRLEWYLQRYGWGTMENLAQFLATRKRILDAGTGLGSHVKLYAENTDGQVYGIDISPTVELGKKHIRGLPNAHLMQMDLMNMSFPLEYFDFIISDQVLHHTPDTERAFKGLVPYLVKGGQIAFYVYKRKGEVREYCDDKLREFTTKMTPDKCWQFSEAVTVFGKALSEIDFDLQRFIYWNIFKCYWNDRIDMQTNVSTNYDWYSPEYAWRHTKEEVLKWIEDSGLELVHLDVGDSGISVRAVK